MSQYEKTHWKSRVRHLMAFLALLICHLIATEAQAAETAYLQLSDVVIYSEEDRIIFYTTGQQTTSPGCMMNHWILTTSNTDHLNRVAAILLTALSTQRPVKMALKPTCGDINHHTFRYVRIQP